MIGSGFMGLQMFLYLVEMYCPDTNENFNKVGVSADGANFRFEFGRKPLMQDTQLSLKEKWQRSQAGQRYISDTTYKTKILLEVKYKYKGDALIAERKLLNALSKYRYTPNKQFSGFTECFKSTSELLSKVMIFMTKDCIKTNGNTPNSLKYTLCSTRVSHILDPIEKHLRVIELCHQQS